MGADESVLGDFLGVGAVFQDPEGDAGHLFPVAFDDFREGGFVAAVKAEHELRVMERLGA